jgi:NAD-dependent deacetylase
MDCNRFYGPEIVFNSKDIPHCECGGIIKPDVVLYEEPLNEDIIDRTIKAISNADLLLVAGTSLTVYPASSFILYTLEVKI